MPQDWRTAQDKDDEWGFSVSESGVSWQPPALGKRITRPGAPVPSPAPPKPGWARSSQWQEMSEFHPRQRGGGQAYVRPSVRLPRLPAPVLVHGMERSHDGQGILISGPAKGRAHVRCARISMCVPSYTCVCACAHYKPLADFKHPSPCSSPWALQGCTLRDVGS